MIVFSTIKRFRQKFNYWLSFTILTNFIQWELWEFGSFLLHKVLTLWWKVRLEKTNSQLIQCRQKESFDDLLDEKWKVFRNSIKRTTSQGKPRFQRSTLIPKSEFNGSLHCLATFSRNFGTTNFWSKISRSVARTQSALCMLITYLSFVANEGSSTSRNCSHNSCERLEVRSSYLRQVSCATCCSSAVPRSRLLHSANWCSRSDLNLSGSSDDMSFKKEDSCLNICRNCYAFDS